ncbi:hypothetical protein H257_14357 [Aphanomyces astaci]|uniref:Uncharacterized protein n=1 Tax=Aphanomyces astaci TaxID=112090 RepID=W4FTK2_APHAT|nr:hypothetical protein H257_14357 [Aphanomyces astaci]ETV69988.1 hypothetical protein H257_14357 [Aphanomyces astaci]|eukprot:XP_009840431.1 hypothetical protein H257_14357 [Aphanomyces astaci]
MQCPYHDCDAVETIQHALMACPRIRPLWDVISEPWLQFGLRFEWTYILDVTKVNPAPEWIHVAPMLVVLWTMLTAGVMRRLWIYRNKVKYEGTAGPYVPVMLELVLLQWSMQVRRHLQLPTTLDDERTQIQTVLGHFGQHPSYHGNNNGTGGVIKRSKLGRHPAAVSGKTAAKWSDDSVTCMFRLRFVKLAHKFENVKNNQMRRDAYELLAAELSVEVDQVLSAEQVQNKLHELKKKWLNPKVKATGNGSAVRTKPQYFDIMFEYWGTKLGYSHSSLLSSDPDVDVDSEVSTLSLDVGSDSDSVMGRQNLTRINRPTLQPCFKAIKQLAMGLKALGRRLENNLPTVA